MVRQVRTISNKKMHDSREGERYSAMDVESMDTLQNCPNRSDRRGRNIENFMRNAPSKQQGQQQKVSKNAVSGGHREACLSNNSQFKNDEANSNDEIKSIK